MHEELLDADDESAYTPANIFFILFIIL